MTKINDTGYKDDVTIKGIAKKCNGEYSATLTYLKHNDKVYKKNGNMISSRFITPTKTLEINNITRGHMRNNYYNITSKHYNIQRHCKNRIK